MEVDNVANKVELFFLTFERKINVFAWRNKWRRLFLLTIIVSLPLLLLAWAGLYASRLMFYGCLIFIFLLEALLDAVYDLWNS